MAQPAVALAYDSVPEDINAESFVNSLPLGLGNGYKGELAAESTLAQLFPQEAFLSVSWPHHSTEPMPVTFLELLIVSRQIEIGRGQRNYS